MIKKGSLVKWYELYGDVHIVRDYGKGIVVEIHKNNHFKDEVHYKVLTSKGRLLIFEDHCVEYLNS